MKIVLIILGILAAFIAIVVVIGSILPKHHSVSREKFLNSTPHEAFAVITDFAHAPKWRHEVARVEVVSPKSFREFGRHGAVLYEVVESTPDQRLVTRVPEQGLGYSGTWTYTLVPDGRGVRLRIQEDADVTNVVFRVVGRFLIGHTATIDAYLGALKKHLAVEK